jgi:hypothetical protein
MVTVECPTCGDQVVLVLDEDDEFAVAVESVPAGSRLVVTTHGHSLSVHECGGPSPEQREADRAARALAALPPLRAIDEVPEDAQWIVRVQSDGTEHTIVMRPVEDDDTVP